MSFVSSDIVSPKASLDGFMAISRAHFFGEFRLDATQHALFRQDALIPLSPKAVEILLFLVERHGRIVEKKELLDGGWPDTLVEEVRLARHVSVLRKILSESDVGQSYIETIPKRGYRFVAPVTEAPPDSEAVSPPGGPSTLPGGALSPHRRWLVGLALILVERPDTWVCSGAGNGNRTQVRSLGRAQRESEERCGKEGRQLVACRAC